MDLRDSVRGVAAAVGVATLVAVRVAHAQPGAMEPMPLAQPELLSESTALWLSLGGTIGAYGMYAAARVSDDNSVKVGFALAGFAGSLLAPSFGHWYSGKVLTRGLGFRAGALGVGFVALTVAVSCEGFFGGHEGESASDCDAEIGTGIALALVGAGMWVYGTIDDIAQAPRRAARINEARLGATYALVPTASDDRVGLAFVGRF